MKQVQEVKMESIQVKGKVLEIGFEPTEMEPAKQIKTLKKDIEKLYNLHDLLSDKVLVLQLRNISPATLAFLSSQLTIRDFRFKVYGIRIN
jgi:hypothetical protein